MSEMKPAKIGLLAAETPPPKTHTSGRTAAIVALVPDLREQPKTWFRIGEFASRQGATNYATKLRKSIPQVEWESRSFEGGSILWARWVGSNGGKPT